MRYGARVRRLAAIVVATVLMTLSLITPFATAAPAESCAEPVAGAQAERRDAAAVGMDQAAVDDALDFAMRKNATAVQIYRYGCLIGARSTLGNVPFPLFSATKGVTAVAVGRAITLGYFDLDDPLGTFFPQADPAHAALTVRQVLNQTTGLHFSWPADIASMSIDQVRLALSTPPANAPGTTFQYAQAVLALLPKIIEITTGADFQDFVQREVMQSLGIDRANWIWLRDRSGNSVPSGGLAMRAADLARIGRLMIQDGRWGGAQLIDADYIRQGTQPTAANSGYGFLWWLNAGDNPRGVEPPTPKIGDRPVFYGSPRDMWSFSGALGQYVAMVPSRDLVIVRLGGPSGFDPANPAGALIGSNNADNSELFRRVSAAVTDLPAEPYVDVYAGRAPMGPLVRSSEDLAKLADPQNVAAMLLGVGPYASTECNILWCNGSPLPADIFRLLLDVSGQIAAAAQAVGNPPR